MTDSRYTTRDLLPEPTLRRLPWYLAHVRLLQAQGVEYVSSTQIAKEINVDASQIAKDLSHLHVKGKTRIGYEVSSLIQELTDFLGFKNVHNACMVGVGSLGGALLHDNGLQQFGLNIVAGFDINPEITGTTQAGVPVFHIDRLAEVQQQMEISIAILAVPTNQAQAVTDHIVSAGLKAIWNFTPIRIKVAQGIVIQNTSIYAHLAVMYNRLENVDSGDVS